MKTSEFEKIVHQNGFYLVNNHTVTQVLHKNDGVLAEIYFDECGEYGIWDAPSDVAKAVVDYATTPVEERKDEKRWNIVIGDDQYDHVVAWVKTETGDGKYFVSDGIYKSSLDNSAFIFTDDEFSQLVKRLKSLPHGDVYAKIAELGKREVKSNDDR